MQQDPDPTVVTPVTPEPPAPTSGSRPWWRRRWGIAAIAIGVLVVLSGIGGALGGRGEPGAADSPTPSSAAAASTATATPETHAPTPSGAASSEPSIEPTPAATPVATSAPAVKPIVLKGKGSRKTKPFTMVGPATVDLAFTGSGNFISSIAPVGGGVFDSVSLSNTIGKTKFRTYVYDEDLDGARSYADVIASSGSWTITITAGVPSAVPAPASFSGKWGLNTRLVHLEGDYTVTFNHAGSGNFIVQLVPPGGTAFDGESIANEIGKVKDSTEIYSLEGDYYFDVIADGAWTIAIKPQ
jgi:hypothetical protein